MELATLRRLLWQNGASINSPLIEWWLPSFLHLKGKKENTESIFWRTFDTKKRRTQQMLRKGSEISSYRFITSTLKHDKVLMRRNYTRGFGKCRNRLRKVRDTDSILNFAWSFQFTYGTCWNGKPRARVFQTTDRLCAFTFNSSAAAQKRKVLFFLPLSRHFFWPE